MGREEHRLNLAASQHRKRLARGDQVDLRDTPGERVKASIGQNWLAKRTVDTSVLVELLSVRPGAKGWTHRPLWLAGARITGSIDLVGATLGRPLHFEDCFIEQSIELTDVEAVTISLTGCFVPRVEASGLNTRGDLSLCDGFTATDVVNLHGATVGGTLDCDGGHFSNPQGLSLDCGSIVVKESMWAEWATFMGEVLLLDAHISGQLVCDGATFTHWGGDALTADSLVVDGDMFCMTGFAARGTVRLPIAHIGGGLNCSGGSFTNPRGKAIYATDLSVDGPMSCSNGFEAAGMVELTGAHIGCSLKCNEAKFTNPDGTALGAAGLAVEGSMSCQDGFEAVGTVELTGARISGNLNLCAASLANLDSSAGSTSKARSNGSTARGALQLIGTEIGGDLNCAGAKLSDVQHGALNARRVVIGGDMFCSGSSLRAAKSTWCTRRSAGTWTAPAAPSSARQGGRRAIWCKRRSGKTSSCAQCG
ncbi:hypothetical protein OG558_23690 [Kribbella sp. NBC_01510]|uniref:hypothetical protein n=1 Tax=Kribbella sp. NBC_01510 TaxID=2903581 RepID=UPI00386F5C7A